MTPFAVLGERAAGSRFEQRSGAAFLPMVGRDQELALLLERWAQAKSGEGQAVLLVGALLVLVRLASQGASNALARNDDISPSMQVIVSPGVIGSPVTSSTCSSPASESDSDSASAR